MITGDQLAGLRDDSGRLVAQVTQAQAVRLRA